MAEDDLFPMSISLEIAKQFPDEVSRPHTKTLAAIWTGVLREIIDGSQQAFLKDIQSLHIHLKPEIVVLLTDMCAYLAHEIIKERASGETLSSIDVEAERAYHLSAQGRKAIEKTGEWMTSYWMKRYKERWEPKTAKKLAAENIPKIPKPRTPKTVHDNHFISDFFLRTYWAEANRLTLKSRDEGETAHRSVSVASWGFERHLYSDRLEDRFQLIEGDAVKTLQKILTLYPLNESEQNAFFGYLIVQKMRNPFFRQKVIADTMPVSINSVGEAKANDPMFQRAAFETLFDNNKLYDEITHSIFWSKWVLVKADKPVFVLPDTFCILMSLKGRRLLIASLTPHVCFVATGFEETERRFMPYILKDETLAADISQCLFATAIKEVVCHSANSISLPSAPLEMLLLNVMDRIEVWLALPRH